MHFIGDRICSVALRPRPRALRPWGLIDQAREEIGHVRAATDVHASRVVPGCARLLNLDSFGRAFGTRPDDTVWRWPADRVRSW